MRNVDKFPTYAEARDEYFNNVCPGYGAKATEEDFCAWLFVEWTDDTYNYWLRLQGAGLLTAQGERDVIEARRERSR